MEFNSNDRIGPGTLPSSPPSFHHMKSTSIYHAFVFGVGMLVIYQWYILNLVVIFLRMFTVLGGCLVFFVVVAAKKKTFQQLYFRREISAPVLTKMS